MILTEATAHIAYRCVSDRYDPHGDEYALPEFLFMCRECFGEAPDLHKVGSEWHDEHGPVLVEATP